MKTQSMLSYAGSDAGVAEAIASFFRDCNRVTIPACGGMSILKHLQHCRILAFDANDNALTFYRTLKGPHRDELIKRCQETLSHPAELRRANDLASGLANGSTVEHAWSYWARCSLGRGGEGGTENIGRKVSFRYTNTGGNNASRITSMAHDLDEWADMIKNVEFADVECGIALIGKLHDNTKHGLYIDWPWDEPAGEMYEKTFTEADHRRAAEAVQRFNKTKVVIRYGDSPLIRELYPSSCWTWHDAQSRTQSNSVRGEVWITRNC